MLRIGIYTKCEGERDVIRETIIRNRVWSLNTCLLLLPFQCCLNETPFEHVNSELGQGNQKVLAKCMVLSRYFRKYHENMGKCLRPSLFRPELRGDGC